jgi:hypothetical protein
LWCWVWSESESLWLGGVAKSKVQDLNGKSR